jgi:glutamyl-tRNA synthetase
MSTKVVTRIAPSPTGQMHIGTVRTALFNYLFAKQHGGTYFVRIEDTDRERNKEEWVDAIWEDFEWCNLPPDAKYRTSERLQRHIELLTALIASGKAYVSREPKKDDPSQEVEVVRLKNPNTTITFTDLIRGEITFDTTELGDFVIARSITDPLYHFAVVADDGDAGVTHVLRAEEHISNTPRQILLLEALGFERPLYGHFPLILAPDRSKLSKRKHGASIENYREQGFIPEAIINYLAMLGWNPGTEQELFTLDELQKVFSLDRVHKGGAVFDIEKMRWFNHEHLKRLSDEEYKKRLEAFVQKEVGARLIPLLKDRAMTLQEAADLLQQEFDFLENPVSYDAALLLNKGKLDPETTKKHLLALKGLVANISVGDSTEKHIQPWFAPYVWEDNSPDTTKGHLMPYADQEGRGNVLWPLRVALSGKDKSPDPFTIIWLIGTEEATRRIEAALNML